MLNRMMFYGGFGLAVVLFILAVLFFIIFKIPSVHRYFRKNKKHGLVEAVVGATTGAVQNGPKRITRAEYENLTEVITLEEPPDGVEVKQELTTEVDPNQTEILD